tara:strand:+ start:213 stop:491 length:279 start_codon:yes stop_codon:yes gene_type:complete
MSAFLPALKELPPLIDSKSRGLKLEATLPTALPPIDETTSGSEAKRIAAAELLRDIGAAFDVSRAQQARSRAIARSKDRSAQRAAEQFGRLR